VDSARQAGQCGAGQWSPEKVLSRNDQQHTPNSISRLKINETILVFWYFQASLSPVIAGIAVYIAIRQWLTNRQRVKLDIFDRRFRVFLEVRKVLSSVIPEGSASNERFLRFRTGVAQSYFIFGPEIETYLDEIYSHGIKLAYADGQRRSPKEQRAEDHDSMKFSKEVHTHLTWLMGQLPVAKEKFKKYLDVSKL
jgi:hypothetical protein